MADLSLKHLSVFLSLVLRHKPDCIGITLEQKGGWAQVDELLLGMERAGKPMTREILEEIVRTDEKGRYAFSPDGKKIRACQGHSVLIDLELEPVAPPELLWHGTAARTLESIRREGLQHMSRQYVHLSPDAATARKVGARHGGTTVLLPVLAGQYHRDGGVFYRSDNGVWLTSMLPPRYIDWSAVQYIEKEPYHE